MTARVEWLPLGHITHGYRRVFILYKEDVIQHVVVIAPMPYETVYSVQQLATGERMTDPALWWGLSTIVALVSNGTLLNPTNPDIADDGYLQIRPQAVVREELLPIAAYQKAVSEGVLFLSDERR